MFSTWKIKSYIQMANQLFGRQFYLDLIYTPKTRSFEIEFYKVMFPTFRLNEIKQRMKIQLYFDKLFGDTVSY